MAETLARIPPAPPASAWVKVVETADAIFYLALGAIRKDGLVRGTWELQDMKKRAPDGAMSMRVYAEFDCAQERHRILSVATYAGPMLGGEILSDETRLSEWRPIKPGTASASIRRIICEA